MKVISTKSKEAKIVFYYYIENLMKTMDIDEESFKGYIRLCIEENKRGTSTIKLNAILKKIREANLEPSLDIYRMVFWFYVFTDKIQKGNIYNAFKSVDGLTKAFAPKQIKDNFEESIRSLNKTLEYLRIEQVTLDLSHLHLGFVFSDLLSK